MHLICNDCPESKTLIAYCSLPIGIVRSFPISPAMNKRYFRFTNKCDHEKRFNNSCFNVFC